MSTIFNNPATTTSRQSAALILEDVDNGNDYIQTAALTPTSKYIQSSKISPLYTGKDNVRVKRVRRARLRGQHYTNATALTGTITVSNGSPNIVGAGTSFLSQLNVGDFIYITDTGGTGLKTQYIVSTVTDNTHAALTVNYAGINNAGLAVTADHYAPLAYTLQTNNAGQAGSVSDTTRYHFGTAGQVWDDSVLFVFNDNQRGLDLQTTISAAAYKLKLKAEELDYHTRQVSA